MRFFGLWTILVALCISVVAAYYSIVGLVAIFAASAIPVIIMGSVLEVGKITTAVWLHTYWNQAGFLIKTYLVIATLLLMFITSMGIFGFLSKAHIQQAAVGTEAQAQLVRIESTLSRNTEIIQRSEEKIVKLETADDTANAKLQSQIADQERSIERIYARLGSDTAQLNSALEQTIAPYNTKVEQLQTQLIKLTELTQINTRDREAVRTLQAFVGSRPDGAWGSQTAARVEEFKLALEAELSNTLDLIKIERTATAQEISRVRSIAESNASKAEELIGRLSSQLGTASDLDVEVDIQKQRDIISEAEAEIDQLIEKKYEIEAETRLLEAEVGPVKYIAELIYGEQAGKDTLEQAVRWVILILVAVFDPLAVVLVIAGLTMFEAGVAKRRKEKEDANNVINTNVEEAIGTETFARHKPVNQESVQQESEEILDKTEYETKVVSNGLTQKEIDIILREQLELNQTTRNKLAKVRVNETINKMKADGEWPADGKNIDDLIDVDPELQDMLNKADEQTLAEVLDAIKKQE
jgi:hypothetical protein